MSTLRRVATLTAVGALGGVVVTLGAGLGYVIHDWQRAAPRTRTPRRITK